MIPFAAAVLASLVPLCYCYCSSACPCCQPRGGLYRDGGFFRCGRKLGPTRQAALLSTGLHGLTHLFISPGADAFKRMVELHGRCARARETCGGG